MTISSFQSSLFFLFSVDDSVLPLSIAYRSILNLNTGSLVWKKNLTHSLIFEVISTISKAFLLQSVFIYLEQIMLGNSG